MAEALQMAVPTQQVGAPGCLSGLEAGPCGVVKGVWLVTELPKTILMAQSDQDPT